MNKVGIEKAFEAVDKLNRLNLLCEVATYLQDSECGYGWRKGIIFSVHRITEQCQKCGCIADDYRNEGTCNRHIWKRVSINVFTWDSLQCIKNLTDSINEFCEGMKGE